MQHGLIVDRQQWFIKNTWGLDNRSMIYYTYFINNRSLSSYVFVIFCSKCELCGKVQWKYKCPRCDKKTCCLACVKQHKVETNCNGIRDKTAFVKMKAMTDMHLLSGMMCL